MLDIMRIYDAMAIIGMIAILVSAKRQLSWKPVDDNA